MFLRAVISLSCVFTSVFYLAGERAFDFSDFLLHFLCLFFVPLLSIVSFVYLVLGFLGLVGLGHLSHLGNGSAPKILVAWFGRGVLEEESTLASTGQTLQGDQHC